MAIVTPLTINAGRIKLLQPGQRLSGSLVLINGRPCRLPTSAGLDIAPDWATGTWPAVRSALSLYNATAPLGTANTTATFGATGLASYKGGVLAPNGCIYCIPVNTTTVLKIDTSNDTLSFFGSLSSSTNKWAGGVLAPNGMIYGVPSTSGTILKIDPTTDTPTTFGTVSGNWYGGCVAPNGMIYCAPYSATTTVLKINPTNDTYSTFGALSASAGWCGLTLAPNGMIYGAPFNGGAALKINPTTDAATTFGVSLGGWNGLVTALNGNLYGIPVAINANILKIDPTTDTASLFAGASATYYRQGGCLAPNGLIYCGPSNNVGNPYLVINPMTETVTTTGNVGGMTGLILAPNGKMYGIPGNSAYGMSITTGFSDIPLDLCLSPYFNKF